jgi:hypothetical protein
MLAGGDRRERLAVLLLLLALLWFWPTFEHGLRSDDFLVSYDTDRLSGTMRGDRRFGEFARPWFDAGELYWPMIRVRFGVELALCPSPGARHVLNTLLVATAAMATAATAGVLLHPAAVETAA